jgi:type VI protein secretion system component VasK
MAGERIDRGLWVLVGAVGAWCLVTMALVPLLALGAGAYLGVTGQYVAAVAILVLGAGAGAWWWRRRRRSASVRRPPVDRDLLEDVEHVRRGETGGSASTNGHREYHAGRI